ncbi:hypothetical protein D3C72_967360 [compost metagenome]
MAAPPALEFQEARAFGVGLGVDVVELLPQRIGGIELLEVLHQPGAVEAPVAQVGGQRRQPRAAQQPAAVAHRVVPAHARPVRQRRTGHQQRPGTLGSDRGQDHQRPAGLAVADDEGLAGCVRVALADDLEEGGLGARHRFDGLPWTGLLEEGDEVAGMPAAQCDADLAVRLEAADAGAVARARVHHHEGALVGIGRIRVRRHDAQQRVVDGLGHVAPVHQHFMLEHQHGRHAAALMLGSLVAAPAQDIEEQDAALPGVDAILPGGLGQGMGSVSGDCREIRKRRRRCGSILRRSETAPGGLACIHSDSPLWEGVEVVRRVAAAYKAPAAMQQVKIYQPRRAKTTDVADSCNFRAGYDAGVSSSSGLYSQIPFAQCSILGPRGMPARFQNIGSRERCPCSHLRWPRPRCPPPATNTPSCSRAARACPPFPPPWPIRATTVRSMARSRPRGLA